MTKDQEEKTKGWFLAGFVALVICGPPILMCVLFGWKAGLAIAAVPVFIIFGMWQAGDLSFARRADNGEPSR